MNGIIIITVIAIVGTGEVRGIVTGKQPTFHPILAGFFVGIFLYVFAVLNADIARKICYFLIVTALILNGTPIVGYLNQSNTAPRKSTTHAPKPSAPHGRNFAV